MGFLVQIFGSIILFTMMITVLLPVSLLSWRIKSHSKRMRFIGPAWKLFIRVAFIGTLSKVYKEDRRENKTYTMPPGLYVANHQSILDIPLALTLFIIPPIMKKEILKIPIFGIIAKSTGAIPVDRKDPNSRKNVLVESLKRLDEGVSLQIYPEGTRSRTDFPKPVSEIKTPIIHYCFKNNIQVTPVSLYGTRYVFNKKGIVKPFQKLGIITHQEVHPKDFSNESEFSEYIWEKVCEGHRELYDKLHPQLA